ncbi:MAG: alpha/beta fold hydrolase [Candidatus Enteromonas sp.]
MPSTTIHGSHTHTSDSTTSFHNRIASGDPIATNASITVFTHGMGGAYTDWLSAPSEAKVDQGYFPFKISKDNVFVLDASQAHGTAPKGTSFDVSKTRLLPISYSEANSTYSVLSEGAKPLDFAKHIVLIYSGFDDTTEPFTNERVYHPFERALDNFLEMTAAKTGITPKVNLVGHSRGGITNLLYAMDHPSVVANLVSVGTPYGGSRIWEFAKAIVNISPESHLNMYQHLMDIGTLNDYATRWNALCDANQEPETLFIKVSQTYQFATNNISYYIGDNEEILYDIFEGLYEVSREIQKTFGPFLGNLIDILNVNLEVGAPYQLALAVDNMLDLIPFGLGNLIKPLFRTFFEELIKYCANDFRDSSKLYLSDTLVDKSSQGGEILDGHSFTAKSCDVIFDNFDPLAPMARPGQPVAHNFETKNQLVYEKIEGALTRNNDLHAHQFTTTFDQNSHFVGCSCGAQLTNAGHEMVYRATVGSQDLLSCACGYTEQRDHDYNCVSTDYNNHTMQCPYCLSSYTEAHSIQYLNAKKAYHIAYCSCGYQRQEPHFYNPRGICTSCGRRKDSDFEIEL